MYKKLVFSQHYKLFLAVVELELRHIIIQTESHQFQPPPLALTPRSQVRSRRRSRLNNPEGRGGGSFPGQFQWWKSRDAARFLLGLDQTNNH
jgi:hypothetical protein